jgi:hypothetical protein
MAKPMLSEWQRLTMPVVLVVLKFQAQFLVTAMNFSSFSNEISTNSLNKEQYSVSYIV